MVVVAALLVVITAAGMSGGSVPAGAQEGSQCAVPLDIALVFDHSSSMNQDGGTKLAAAKAAALGFIDDVAGGDDNLSPHQMALTGFSDGNASADVALTSTALTLKSTINGYFGSGFTNIGRAAQLGQLQLLGGTDPDIMILISDGSANTPQDLDSPTTASVDNDLYIDVNGDGFITGTDQFLFDYPNPEVGTATDIKISNGLLEITTTAELIDALDVDGDGLLTDADDYNFGPGFNFSVIDGTLYLDGNGNGDFALTPLSPQQLHPRPHG